MNELFDHFHVCECDSCAENDGEHEDFCEECHDCQDNAEASLDADFEAVRKWGTYR